MKSRLFLSIGLIWVAVMAVAAAATQTIQVTPLARDGRVYVSFKLAEGLTEEVSEAIHSGLTITFSYDVDLKRSAAVWIDRTIASSTVAASVKYRHAHAPVQRDALRTTAESAAPRALKATTSCAAG